MPSYTTNISICKRLLRDRKRTTQCNWCVIEVVENGSPVGACPVPTTKISTFIQAAWRERKWTWHQAFPRFKCLVCEELGCISRSVRHIGLKLHNLRLDCGMLAPATGSCVQTNYLGLLWSHCLLAMDLILLIDSGAVVTVQ